MENQRYAEDYPYWKTSKTSPDGWIEKAKKEIEKAGGVIVAEMIGAANGKAAIVLTFDLDGDRYVCEWPVLQSRTGDTLAAKRQAATMLYHDIKSRTLLRRVRGARFAFAQYILTPQGVALHHLLDRTDPDFNVQALLPAPVVDGEVRDG